MKLTLTIVMMWASASFSQCANVFNKQVNCPDLKDSMFIYNNAVKVNDFFEKSSLYKKTRTRDIRSEKDKKDIFVTLQQARGLFFVVRKDGALPNEDEKFMAIKPSPKYKDIDYSQYFQEVDEYRFYQRELENQIINADAPMPMYDNRISPVVVNEYKCIDTSSIYYGDVVNIPLYIPVVVKPVSMLTSSEQVMRKEILDPTPSPVAKTNEIIELPIDAASRVQAIGEIKGLPVYLYDNNGSGSIIGFMNNGKFRIVRPEEYKEFVVLKYAQDLLENKENLKKWLKIHYGDYCIALN